MVIRLCYAKVSWCSLCKCLSNDEFCGTCFGKIWNYTSFAKQKRDYHEFSIKKDNGAAGEAICSSQQDQCWGNGICDPFMNNSKSCFDGGDCTYRYGMMSKCRDEKCCYKTMLCQKFCDCDTIDPLMLSFCNQWVIWYRID